MCKTRLRKANSLSTVAQDGRACERARTPIILMGRLYIIHCTRAQCATHAFTGRTLFQPWLNMAILICMVSRSVTASINAAESMARNCSGGTRRQRLPMSRSLAQVNTACCKATKSVASSLLYRKRSTAPRMYGKPQQLPAHGKTLLA